MLPSGKEKFKTEKNIKLEPVEEVVIDVDESFSSTVISSMNNRKSEMIDMKTSSAKTQKVKTCENHCCCTPAIYFS